MLPVAQRLLRPRSLAAASPAAAARLAARCAPVGACRTLATDAATQDTKTWQTKFYPDLRPGTYTHLPTPLPMDVRDRHSALRRRGAILGDSKDVPAGGDSTAELIGTSDQSVERANLDEIYFPTSRTVETLALFQACLSTGLIARAHKLMREMRAESHTRLQELQAAHAGGASDDVANATPLKLWSYNAMLHAYFVKAAQSESEDALDWAGYAWDLWRDMVRDGAVQLDPRPDASTMATMALGIAQLQAENKYADDLPGVKALLEVAPKLGISLDAVFSSSVRQLDTTAATSGAQMPLSASAIAQELLSQFQHAAAELGDQGAQRQLDEIRAVLQQDADVLDAAPAAPAAADALEGVEEVRPVLKKDAATDLLTKPFNLQTLQDSLALVREARTRTSDLYERQRWMEHSALEAARKRLAHETENLKQIGLDSGAMKSRSLQAWMWDWYKKLEAQLGTNIDRMGRKVRRKDGAHTMDGQLYPFLRLLPPSKMAMLAIIELMRMQGITGVADGVKTTRALLAVGKAVETEYTASMMQKHPEIFVQARHAQQLLGQRKLVDLAVRRDIKAWHERCEHDHVETTIPKWTQTIRARVGSFLVDNLMEVATVTRRARDRDGELWEEEQPAFYSAYEYIQGKKLGVIRLNEVVSQRLDKESVRETLHPRQLPMLVPPRPWLTHDSGGYFSVKMSAMRFKDSVEQSSYLRAASDNNGLEVVLAGLDVLGNTAWHINREVFDVVLAVWNTGEALADLPPAEMSEPEPERPAPHDIKAKSVYQQRLRQWNAQRASNHSRRCDINYKLEIARTFLGETFYFPHNMDFRGRAYPIPPHLNHIGNDLCRGLLKFADAKPLGEAGLRWLHIHLANVYGFDKASFAEREQFAKDHEKEIRESAAQPLDGSRWWMQADDPWQCLATCYELVKAWDHPDGAVHFPSQLPVHQDGTCNGLQHYAALGGDLQGAKQVNLRGGDRPADVYTGVAELVIKQLHENAAAGDDTAQLLLGKVTRKVVKQTVMTTVYGVTFIGAKNQVMRQLIDRGDIPAEQVWYAASYLAKVIIECIGDLFSGANQIQEWLTMSARLIAKSIPPERVPQSQLLEAKSSRRGAKAGTTRSTQSTREGREQMTSVIWTSALGLPVVQPYRRIKKHQVATAVQSVYIRDPNQNYEVNPAKQASAFPPNFIHSLDASHMFLTALECHSAGLVFASVHDSYWTHACDIDTMSDVIRDTFVRLHSEDILVRLRDEFLERYKGYKVPASVLAQTRASARPKKRTLVDVDEADADADAAADADADAAADAAAEAAADEPVTPSQPLPPPVNGFYELADVLPEIPQKGSFDVSEIKRSLYFFS